MHAQEEHLYRRGAVCPEARISTLQRHEPLLPAVLCAVHGPYEAQPQRELA